MASTLYPPISSRLVALLLLLAFSSAAAQNSPTKPISNANNPYNTNVSPALAILVVAIVCAFLLLGFFSIYLRRCSGDNSAVAPGVIAGITGRRSRRGTQIGLDPTLLEKFPTMVYSSVKKQKLGKESLECAVCLCEFEDDDVLRLLPRCNHVYHRDCVDIWFATHVTCPVCRSNLTVEESDPPPETVAVEIAEDRHPDLEDLVRIGSLRREARSGSVKPKTGDWAAVVAAAGGDGGERFTLRLPEDFRREILAAGQLRRSASFAFFPASSRRGWRGLRILGRSFSARTPAATSPEGSFTGEAKGVVVTPVKLTDGSGEKKDDDAVLLGAFNLV